MGRSVQEIDAEIDRLRSERRAAVSARPACPVEIHIIVDTARAAGMISSPAYYDGRGWGAHISARAVYEDCGAVAMFNAAVSTMDEYDILVRRMK